MAATSLYLHIPFCISKCAYCDFAVRVLNSPSQIDRYLDILCAEIAALPPASLETLYLGGGTPALLSGQQMTRLFENLTAVFELNTLKEVTLEANPEGLNKTDFRTFRSLGINRISLGAQSFEAAVLKQAGRLHQPEQIQRAVAQLHTWGFENISLDLIYGLPGQSHQSWEHSLKSALSLNPNHLSLYALEVHEHTAFGHQEQYEKLELPELEVWAYETACTYLAQAGYTHYEIANFARPNQQSRHNLIYWQTQPFLAAGVGAHGYWQGRRYGNPKSMRAYYQQVQNQAWGWKTTPPQSRKEAIEETVFMGLRLLEQGLDLEQFKARFGHSLKHYYPDVLPHLLREGQLKQTGHRLMLNPKSVMFSNDIFMQFLDPVSAEHKYSQT